MSGVVVDTDGMFDIPPAGTDDDTTPRTKLGSGSFGLASGDGEFCYKQIATKFNPKKEFDLMKICCHPNVPQVFKYSENGPMACIKMELAPYGSLEKYKLSEDVLREYCVQVLRAIAHMHSIGYIHCDIKPHNMLLFPDGVVKITDFGSANHVNMCQSCEPGTLCYMDTEFIREANASFATDIWAFGCTLVHLLSGKVPYAELPRIGGCLQTFCAFGKMTNHRELLLVQAGSCSPELREVLDMCFLSRDKRATAEQLLRTRFFE
jgi:mitogen-activated protein kinase kinase kinase